MALEGINAYAISPGATKTKFRSHFNIPSNNMLEPEKIGEVIKDILRGQYNPGVNMFLRCVQLEIR